MAREIDNANNAWAVKLEGMQAKHHAESKKQEAAWQKEEAAKEQQYEKGKTAITDKYDNMEIKEKEDRENLKQQMMAKRDKLLAEKEKRKEKRQAVLDKEKQNWEKASQNYKAQIEKTRSDIDALNAKKPESSEKDKAEAKAKKEQVSKKYQESIDKINKAELQQVKQKFKQEYKEEGVREVQLTKVTKQIESAMADANAKAGLAKLDKNDFAGARKDFNEALYLDGDSKSAKEGLKAISTKAQALYWEAFGMKETNKSKAVRTLEMLMKNLLPTDEIYLKSMMLLEELK